MGWVLGGVLLGLAAGPATGAEPVREAPPPPAVVVGPDGLNALDRMALDNWSPSAARASDWGALVCGLAPLVLLADPAVRDDAATVGLMAAETAVLAGGLTWAVKNIVRRPRPFVYNPDPEIPAALRSSPSASRSFPSGHTATAFAGMVFLATVYDRLHPDSPGGDWVWGGCLAAAATTGYLRFAAGRHYPTDILAGAALGAAAGWLVPKWHDWPDEAGPERSAGRQTFIGVTLGF